MKPFLKVAALMLVLFCVTTKSSWAQSEIIIAEGMTVQSAEGKEIPVEKLTAGAVLNGFDSLSRLDEVSDTIVVSVEKVDPTSATFFNVNGMDVPDTLSFVVSDGMLQPTAQLSLKEYLVRFDGARERLTDLKMSTVADHPQLYRVGITKGQGLIVNSYRVASSQ